jgi:hypothetical protein
MRRSGTWMGQVLTVKGGTGGTGGLPVCAGLPGFTVYVLSANRIRRAVGLASDTPRWLKLVENACRRQTGGSQRFHSCPGTLSSERIIRSKTRARSSSTLGSMPGIRSPMVTGPTCSSG